MLTFEVQIGYQLNSDPADNIRVEVYITSANDMLAAITKCAEAFHVEHQDLGIATIEAAIINAQIVV